MYRYPLLEPEVVDHDDQRLEDFRMWLDKYNSERPKGVDQRVTDIKAGLEIGSWGLLEEDDRCESCKTHQRPSMDGMAGLACVMPVVELDGKHYLAQK